MIAIYYTNISNIEWNEIQSFLPMLSDNEKNRICAIKKDIDRCLTLAGRILLLHGMTKKSLYSYGRFPEIDYTIYGKPYIVNVDFDFSISHSGNMSICAINTIGQIGIDIEELVTTINLCDFSLMFSPSELRTIKDSNNPICCFYDLWTTKESVMKADGRGFTINPLNIKIVNNSVIFENKKWYIYKVNILRDYAISLACSNIQNNIYINEISIKQK
ncbi:MAG: 4'-phosphopantetheinyl transferase superfamily protein [Bacteroidales bacterium]|jgi:4'-phosphopantetheinyl transferase|nr:4'-phosphopantetheinyl transferase superfamily protein [Bacteroidales bacterium]